MRVLSPLALKSCGGSHILKTCTTDLHRSLKDTLPVDSIFTGMAVNLTYLIVVAVYLYLSSISSHVCHLSLTTSEMGGLNMLFISYLQLHLFTCSDALGEKVELNSDFTPYSTSIQTTA